MKIGDVVGRWTLLYRGRNAAGRPLWLAQCQCLVIREVYATDLTPRAGWSCGHRSVPRAHPKIGKTSRFRGVTNDQANCPSKPWKVALFVDGVQCYVGRFRDEVEAARAYDRAALELWGPHAILNFLREEEVLMG